MSLVETEPGREIQRTPLHLLSQNFLTMRCPTELYSSSSRGSCLFFSEDALESDDELELDEDDEHFFSLMGGTICFFLVILLGF